ncbi:MAG: APC family permease [Chloroflexi bacterium]|nr:APC family permease [Chloroflexota bacterium]
MTEERPQSEIQRVLRHGSRLGDVFVRIILPPRLQKVLGVPGLFATAYGDVGSSIFYSLGIVALYALGLTPMVLVLAGIFFLFTGLTYAEGSTALPEAGGSGAYARRAFNDLAGFTASWMLMMDYLVTIAISAFTAANYLGYFLPGLRSWPNNSLMGIGIVLGLVAINALGIKESARFNLSLVVLAILSLLILGALGTLLIINVPQLLHNIHWGIAPTTNQLLFGISISMMGYTGIETIANLGGETRQAGKNVPRTVVLVFAIVLLFYVVFSMTGLSAYPVHQTPGGEWVTGLSEQYLEDPMVGIVKGMPGNIQPILSFGVAILAVAILIIATNAGIIGASRLVYFMGIRQQLPRFISRINRRSRVPLIGILVSAVLAALLITTGQVTVLADLYAFGAMAAYTLAHISIIALRVKEPDLPRPFKIPLNIRIRGREIPVTAVIGGLATGATWFIVTYTHELGRIVGFAWIIVGLFVYVVYRRATGRPVIAIPKPRAQYRR